MLALVKRKIHVPPLQDNDDNISILFDLYDNIISIGDCRYQFHYKNNAFYNHQGNKILTNDYYFNGTNNIYFKDSNVIDLYKYLTSSSSRFHDNFTIMFTLVETKYFMTFNNGIEIYYYDGEKYKKFIKYIKRNDAFIAFQTDKKILTFIYDEKMIEKNEYIIKLVHNYLQVITN